MNPGEIAVDRLTRGLSRALDMMVDDLVSTVIVVGVKRDGRGIILWSGGDERVANQLEKTIIKTLPLTPEPPPFPIEDDGA